VNSSPSAFRLLLPLCAASLLAAGRPSSASTLAPLAAAGNHVAPPRAQRALVARDGMLLPRELVIPTPRDARVRGWLSPEARSSKNLLYVADQGPNAVDIFSEKGSNQQPIGQITEGVSGPNGLFVDHKRNLYVCNFGNGTVTVYPPGAISPSKTLTGAGSPIDVVVDKKGNVFVSNFAGSTNGTVLEYAKGATAPTKTVVQFGAGSFSEGLAFDEQGNLYVAFNSAGGGVLEFTASNPSGTNLGIRVGYVGGMTIDKSGDILLVDQNLPGVDVFAPGQTTPLHQYKPSQLAYDVALDKKNNNLYVSDAFQPPSVNELSYPAGTVVDTITGTLETAFGVATSPEGSL
jgi:sugar lactone lactonase YvrE